MEICELHVKDKGFIYLRQLLSALDEPGTVLGWRFSGEDIVQYEAITCKLKGVLNAAKGFTELSE